MCCIARQSYNELRDNFLYFSPFFLHVWQQFDSKWYYINFWKRKPVIHGDWRKRRTIYSDERDLSRAAEWKPFIRICGRQGGIKSFVWQVWTICLFSYLACTRRRREERKSGRMCKTLAWPSFCTVWGLVGFQRCLGSMHFCFFFFFLFFFMRNKRHLQVLEVGSNQQQPIPFKLLTQTKARDLKSLPCF